MPETNTFKASSIAEVPGEKIAYLGKPVGDMITNGMVLEDGSVMGTLKYVAGFTAFNESVKAEQNGYYVPLKLTGNVRGATMTFIKNGEERDAGTDLTTI